MSTCKIPAEHPLLLTAIIDRLRGNNPRESVHVSCFEQIEDEKRNVDPDGSYENESNFELYLTPENGVLWKAYCDGETCDVREQVPQGSSGCGSSHVVARSFNINSFTITPDPVDMGTGGAGGSGGSGGEAGIGGVSGSGGEVVVDAGTGGVPPDADLDATATPGDAALVADVNSPQDAVVSTDLASVFADVAPPQADAAVLPDSAVVVAADAAPPQADAAVLPDAAVVVAADAAPLPADAAVLPDAAVVVVVDAVPPPADAAPAPERDAGVLPEVPLQSVTFGDNPSGDRCYSRDPNAMPTCLSVGAQMAISAAQLFDADVSPILIEFSAGENQRLPQGLQTLDAAPGFQQFFTLETTPDEIVPENDATWQIVRHLSVLGEASVETIGSLRATVDLACDDNGCPRPNYTFYIDMPLSIGGGLAACQWSAVETVPPHDGQEASYGPSADSHCGGAQ